MDDTSSILLDNRQDCREAAKTLILGAVGRVYMITSVSNLNSIMITKYANI